ncbi:MAG: mandelate racemase/muconate lactonizing enzyme family protein [Pirellulaceae bacterium]|nr:mandelate racemase/muconate lactonizing enzyme family protein [Planctomycetaceae bacterium]
MKIARVDAIQPETPGSPPDWRTQLGQIIVRVQTDDGLTGWGVGGGGRACIHVAETVLRDLLVGADPSDVEGLHAAMFDHTSFYGRKGLVIMAISGVDLALWDIRGKRLNRHVAQLLNPEVEFGRGIPTYCTVFDDDEAETAFTAGHVAIKLHVERFGDDPDVSAIVSLVSRTRERLGPTAQIMVDAFARWTLQTSLEVADAIAPFQIEWLEEPMLPDRLGDYRELAKQSPIKIAGGEHEYTAGGFRELIDLGVHHILQPDINWCGGMTTLVEVYRLAKDAGLQVCPHRGSEPFSIAAIASIDPTPLAESPRRWFRCLTGMPDDRGVGTQLQPGIGFGVDVSEQVKIAFENHAD